MSDKNENLKVGDIYTSTNTGEKFIVTKVNEGSGYDLEEPETQAERQKIEDLELQKMTVRALNIAELAMSDAEVRVDNHYADIKRSHLRVTLAAAILAKMKQ